MDGVGGKPAWAWIFSESLVHFFAFFVWPKIYLPVLEGLATVLAGAASFWIIQDFPDTAKFLTEAERTVVIRRLQGDDQFSAAGENFKTKYIIMALKDWKTWLGSEFSLNKCTFVALIPYSFAVVVYMGCDMPLYAFSLFLPSIINQVKSIYFGWSIC